MKTKKIEGIKSVDFKIVAKGHGVVNWNGPTNLMLDNGKTADNHTMPKLRGYSNLSGKIKEDTGYKYRKEASDIDFKTNPLYISQNCIRHHLFREQAFDLHYANAKNIKNVLASLTGLVRGYVVPSTQNKRTSPLLIEDFVDQLGNGNFEQFGQAGERDSSSFFSKTTFGDTEYISYGSISIEQLQFISLDKKFDRASMEIKKGEGEEVANLIEDYLQTIDQKNRTPKATFHENYVRNGTIFEEGENGILLNQDAMDILIDATLEKLSELVIRQAKSYMYIDEILVDYNDSNKMMRIKRDEGSVSSDKSSNYASYFYAREK
ncbi:type I-Fv CRISPR-associated protein Cas7fv [Sulfuricurvum sp.]|uniref:type I-Fv CRISPR-associated protein Cas7fv n=1 Tax=Sulfuricurvum sp. TaxID=2025608 RepID=UPI00262CC6D6|nr:type I-Fv CRISPR-associated protein Cas7fv [Sulfuricurvum sp.]MDD3596511.1 type I-Fv CRISPR-associated protein Cas7fv [Sulfuricurvum sp.]